MNPRPDLIRIEDILNAISKIDEYKDSLYMYERDEFVKTVFFDAILYNLVIIGEAVRNLTPATKASIPFTRWTNVIALRNHLVHQYAGIVRDLIIEILDDGLIELKLALETK